MSFLDQFIKLNIAWHDFSFTLALVILLAYLLVDGMYAYYTLSVIKKRPVASATVSFMMHFIIAFGVFNYVHNFLYVLPLAIGSWIGTYLVVEKERRALK